MAMALADRPFGRLLARFEIALLESRTVAVTHRLPFQSISPKFDERTVSLPSNHGPFEPTKPSAAALQNAGGRTGGKGPPSTTTLYAAIVR